MTETFSSPDQARMVAAATSNLCEAANASVQGHASEEKLISSAKQVAASTAQLLVACKVKADQDSEAMRRLQVQTHSKQDRSLVHFLSQSALLTWRRGSVHIYYSCILGCTVVM